MYSAIRASKADNLDNFTRQGSLRRVLPAEHKENLFGRQNEDLNKIYRNFHQEYIILAEYKMIQSQNIEGVYVIPSRENPFIWFGVIYVRSGPYEDGIFRFNIVLDDKFPDSEHPKVVFLSEIYHPVIDSEHNELHLKDAFPTWNKSEQHIWQILKYIHWIFNNIEHSRYHSVHKEAADLYKNNRDAFMEKAKMLSKISRDHIYNELPVDDKHNLIFDEYDAEIHDQAKNTMLTQHRDETTKFGHSWVLPGSLKSLGRPPSPDSENES